MCQSLFLNNVAGLRLQFLKTPFLTEHLHGFMVKPQTSDIQVTYEYIRVTYGWHTSTYEWHTDDIRVHTSDIRMTYEYIWVKYGCIRLHTSDIGMTYQYIRMTSEWLTDDMQFVFERKIKLSFLKLFDISLPKYLMCERIPGKQWLFWVIYQIKKGSEISF